MHIFVLQCFTLQLLSCYELVEQLSGEEVCPWRAFEGGANLYHPVHHFRPVLLGHFVAVIWGVNCVFWAPFLEENLERVLLQLLLLEALMVVFEERVIKLTIFDILLHACLELGQLLLDCRHLWRRNSNVDLRKRHSVFGFARALGPRLSLRGALLLVVRGLSLSVDSVVRDLASQDALVFLVQVVDVQPIWQIRKIAVHS